MDRWSRLQPHLQQLLGDEEYRSWVEPLDARTTGDDEIVLASDNEIVLDWVRDHLLRDLQTVARSQFGPSFRLTLAETPDTPAPTETSAAAGPIAMPPVDPEFSFEAFVVGPSNQFAAAAAEAVASRPADAYNPLYIYGESGLGKTHLLHAIANRIRRESPGLEVVYLTTEQFVNDLIDCITRKKMDQFRRCFRAADVLLLDDIQFIAGKERTQEEFFHTFNTLHSTGRQVVFTSDTKPSDLPGLAERLRSRFLQGLLADIQPPDLETRCAILREKARAAGWELPEDVVLFIARRVQKNVRELEGSLKRTLAYAHLSDRPISVDLVRTALAELIPDERAATPAEIIRFIAHHYGIRVADLKGRSQRHSIALPRQVAMYLLRHVLDLSFPEIGKLFGKHHSTVMHAVDQVDGKRRSNPDFDATLTSFTDHFGS